MRGRRVTAAVVASAALLGGCATGAPSSDPSADPPLERPGGTRAIDEPPIGPSDVSFTACSREAAEPSTTNLRPNDLSAADRALAGEFAEYIPDGRLIVEHATELVIPDGEVGFDNGYEAATAGTPSSMVVADGTVTAPVSQLVLDSPSSGRRVAFVEVRLSPEPPVRWEEEPRLGFVTDGGDGGVVATGQAPFVDHGTDLGFVEEYIEAFFPGGDSTSGNVCVLREADGVVDVALFSAGWGDGHYPTFVGRDADGAAVSLVSHGFVVPWVLSGLPGDPPSIPGESDAG